MSATKYQHPKEKAWDEDEILRRFILAEMKAQKARIRKLETAVMFLCAFNMISFIILVLTKLS
jgi:hypothetical protein